MEAAPTVMIGLHRLGIGLALLLLVQGTGVPGIASAATEPEWSASENSQGPGELVAASAAADTLRFNPLELALFSLTNVDRVSNGFEPLAFDSAVLEIARARAFGQLGLAALNHANALGELAFVRLLAEAGLSYSLAGENLARAVADAARPEIVEQALMRSVTHRQNILEPAFNRLAVGVAADSSGRVAFAQIFRATP